MTGRKQSRVSLEQFSVSLPEGTYREMIDIIEKEKRWDGRVEFAREAIREKIERERSKAPRVTDQERQLVRGARPP